MNKKENEQFLTFIEQQFSRNNSLYLTGNDVEQIGLYFYGQDNTDILISGSGDNINFSIKSLDKNSENQVVLAVNIPLAECKELLDYMFSFYKKDNTIDYTGSKREKFVQEETSKVLEWLKQCQLPTTKFDYKTTLQCPNSISKMHELLVGRLLTGNGDKTKVCTAGAIEIPLNLYYSDKDCESFKLIIPCWDLPKYPVLSHFVAMPPIINNMNDMIVHLKNSLPNMSKALHCQVLDEKIPMKEHDITIKLKI